jgi:hypothetical protein
MGIPIPDIVSKKIGRLYVRALSSRILFDDHKNARQETGESQNALLFIREVRERLSMITLDERVHIEVLDEAAQTGISGGAINDMLIAKCAMKANARIIYTWKANSCALTRRSHRACASRERPSAPCRLRRRKPPFPSVIGSQ